MTAYPTQADHRPRPSWSGSFSFTSGSAQITPIAHEVWVNVASGTSSVAITTIDGATTTLGILAAGFYYFPAQVSVVTFTNTSNTTVTGMYPFG